MSNLIFRIHSLYADNGDCFWIEYGREDRPHRIVVDCGTTGTYGRLEKALDFIANMAGENELLIITHIDADHIAGAVSLMKNVENARLFKDIWFNGRAHLEPSRRLEPFGAVQGETLSRALVDNKLPWNSVFNGQAVALYESNKPRKVGLPGGATLTILSPSWDKLRRMQKRWDTEVTNAGLDQNVMPPLQQPSPPGYETFGFDIDKLANWPYEEDQTVPNGTSIAFLLEYRGKSMLLSGDAHPSILVSSIAELRQVKEKGVDLFKVPHHGSRKNVSKELIEAVRCRAALFSSNGAVHGHPDKESVARFIKFAPGVKLIFNCRTQFNEMWDQTELREEWGYETDYGSGQEGISIHLL